VSKNKGPVPKRAYIRNGKNIPYPKDIDEIIIAMDKWKQRTGIKFWAISDVVDEMQKLGWQKTGEKHDAERKN